jgi:hypothetical protein
LLFAAIAKKKKEKESALFSIFDTGDYIAAPFSSSFLFLTHT